MKTTYDLYGIKDQSITKNNVYIIADKETKRAAIVDPACSMKQIEEIVNKYQLTLDTVLITHTHVDHIRRIHDLIFCGCDIYVSRVEAEYDSFYCRNLKLFEDDEAILLGNTKIQCLLTSGHTVGSTCFLTENSLFSGDTIFIEGCGLCPDYDSASEMFWSIVRIRQQVEDSVSVYPGHTYVSSPGKSIYYLKQNNIYFMIEEEKEFIQFRMRKNQKNLYHFI